ncbi:MAG TPA: metallophosphoesterase [Rhodanobacteraceae bacterium]|nr:metallophosphoesterase [Rhodanobacteraceae bacterium]
MNDDRDDMQPERRRFLECMAWAGAGTLWLMKGGMAHAGMLTTGASATDATFSFVQISDSHIGFHQAPNPDPVASLRQSIALINAQPERPDFVLHTGDLTHLSKPEQFDTVAELLKEAKAGRVFCIPGEHDVIGDDGKAYFARFGGGVDGNGWYSFDHHGMHFVALVNVRHLQAGGLGFLGADQIAWLKQDLSGLSSSTPIVVFAHMPMWSLYPQWGWGTQDSAPALALLKRFGSVTVLNGHIHQIQQKVEGNLTFHTARSTAYPQPAPGEGPAPGPLKNLPAGKLHEYIGLRDVRHVRDTRALAITERTLG